MVVITDQMQDAMDNHPIEFIGELGPIERSVLPDGIDADEQVAVQAVAFAVVEGDDVRKIVVLEKSCWRYFMFTSRI